MANNSRPKHFKGLLILAALIFLALVTSFIIDRLMVENATTLKIIEKNYNIYLTGLAALFVIFFHTFFSTYRKILSLLSVVGLVILLYMPIGDSIYSMKEGPVLYEYSIKMDSVSIEHGDAPQWVIVLDSLDIDEDGSERTAEHIENWDDFKFAYDPSLDSLDVDEDSRERVEDILKTMNQRMFNREPADRYEMVAKYIMTDEIKFSYNAELDSLDIEEAAKKRIDELILEEIYRNLDYDSALDSLAVEEDTIQF